MSTGLCMREALHVVGDTATPREEWVIEETPVALLYNGLSYAVMMTTPVDLEDFALGFAICEGIVGDAAEFALVDVVRNEHGIALHAVIPQHRHDALQERQRSMAGHSGCGLCGTSELMSAHRAVPIMENSLLLSPQQIHAGLEQLSQQQCLNTRSGGVHAAAFVHDGHIVVREDVGRHCALDKLVGALLRASPPTDARTGFLAITSRASYEIVCKAAYAGIAVIAAMSAPTDLAIRQAEAAHITLIAFARDGRMNVYSGHERLLMR